MMIWARMHRIRQPQFQTRKAAEMRGGTSLRMRAGQLFCACDSDGLPLEVGREPDHASIRTMALAFALSVLAQILTVSALPLVSVPLAPSEQAKAWPYLALLLGGAVSSFPASILLDVFGRRAAFALGASLGLAGGVMSTWAVIHQQFYGLVIGVAWLGMAQGFALFYRHAGALSAQGGAGPVFASGLAAALLAPLVMTGLESLSGPMVWASALALAGFVYLVTLGVAIRLPARKVGHVATADFENHEGAASPDPTWAVWCGATGLAALAWAVMTAVMAHAPLMMAGCGIGFSASAMAMALHLMAMYAPGLVIGRWVAAWGGLAVSLTGVVLLGLGGFLLMQQSQWLGLTAALVMAGAGWGIATIGATAWLNQRLQPTPLMLAGHDMMLFLAAMLGAASLAY
jgi:MFS family permease